MQFELQFAKLLVYLAPIGNPVRLAASAAHRRLDSDSQELTHMNTRVCTSCKKEKPLSEFHRFGKDGSRIGKWCDECYAKRGAGRPPAPQKQT
jgi:hypothetical protein